MKVVKSAARHLRRTASRLSAALGMDADRHLYDIGFHGDTYLVTLAELLLAQCDYFVETGTNVGTTLRHVARRHPSVLCLSCEPDVKSHACAVRNTRGLSNVELHNSTSDRFLQRVIADHPQILRSRVLFWLDAHGSTLVWPLPAEIGFITRSMQRALILIDDVEVPNMASFGYGQYAGRRCSIKEIAPSFHSAHTYELYYPSYTDRTSRHHPLQGWALVQYGFDIADRIETSLSGRVSKATMPVLRE